MALSGFSFRISERVSYDVVADPPEGAFQQRRATNDFSRRRFRLEWPIVDTTEKDAILAEFDAAKGSAGTATLAHPTDGSVTVMLEDEIEVERRTNGRWALSLGAEIER